MILSIGIYAKSIARSLGEDVNVFSSLGHVINLPISHYCYSGDDKRDEKGFKYEQDYYINGSKVLAVKKRFEEEILEDGRLSLTISFDYYNPVSYNNLGEELAQDVVFTKKVIKIFSGKQLFNRRRKQREYSIQDLESLGFKFESLGASNESFSFLIGYESRMKRIFEFFQLEIGRYISTNSEDFKNGILSAIQGSNTQLIEDLNFLVPMFNADGSITMIETWKGIYSRLS